MTAILQLLVFVAAIAGLIVFGFYRDKREHDDTRQRHIEFPDDNDEINSHRVAMSGTHL